MDPMHILAPNSLGSLAMNHGVDELVANRGLGLSEIQSAANQQAMMQRNEKSTTETQKTKMRTAKARQFGVASEDLGF